MIYLQNEEAVTFSVRDRFCLVGMRPILYLNMYLKKKTNECGCLWGPDFSDPP